MLSVSLVLTFQSSCAKKAKYLSFSAKFVLLIGRLPLAGSP
jgi:hypothetical protein